MTTTWTKSAKHTGSWSKTSSHPATWTKTTPSSTTASFLLLENGSYILQETGFKLILDQSSSGGVTAWSKLTKS